MTDAARKRIASDAHVPAGFISDLHNSVSPDNGVARLRAVLNDTAQMSPRRRDVWLMLNIEDPQERETIAALLRACDGEVIFDSDTR